MKKNSFLKNVILLLFSQGIIKIVGVIYKIYLTNKTGYADTGNALFSAAFQVYAMFLTICSIGVPNSISSLISEKFAIGNNREAYRILKIAITIFGSLGFIASSLLYFFAKQISVFYLQMPETELILKVLSPSIFLNAITAVLKGYFNGKQKMDVTANSLSIEQITKTVAIIIAVEILAKISNCKTEVLVCGVGIATTIGNIISVIYMYVFYLKSRKEIWTDIITSKKYIKERKIEIIKNIFKVSFPIAICAFVGTINKVVDATTIVRILKKQLGEAEAVKQYGILSGKVESLVTFPFSFNMAFTTVLIPTIASCKARGDKEKSKKVLKLNILIGMIIAIPCFVVLFLFPEKILQILYPNASSGSLMLKYSSITAIPSIILQTINSYLQGMKQMKIQMLAIGIASIIKLILNMALISNKNLGIYGAIISNIISQTFALIILLTYVFRKEGIKIKFQNLIIKLILLTVLTMGTIKFAYNFAMVKNEILKLIIAIIIG